jgi:hypothetical protein
MPSTYVPPHRRNDQTPSLGQHESPSTTQRFRATAPDVMFFGDSFVRLFGLVEHPCLKVQAFKGASAKGIGREGNSNRATILQQVTRYQPERVVVCFGNVDVHLSYYYTKYATDGATIDLQSVARAYVEFAASLPARFIHIVGVYPSAVKDEYVVTSLQSYGAVPEGVSIPEDDLSIESRQDRVQEFNRILKVECDRHDVHLENIFSAMVDTRTKLLKPTFQDVSPCNIHVVWETTIFVWIERWPWLRKYVSADFEKKIQTTLDDYLGTKEWAKTTHIASKVGVGEAFHIARTET